MVTQAPDIEKMRFARELPKAHIQALLEISIVREFPAREMLFEEYEALRSVFICLEGDVVLGINIPRKGRINIGTVHPESIIAWSALFPPYLSTASAQAITPVQVLDIPAARLREQMDGDSAFGYNMMKLMSSVISQRLSDTRLQLANAITT